MSLEIMIEGGVLGDVLVENGSHGGTDDFGVVVVGGGNSAGQAAMYLSRAAKCVHVVVRGSSLAASMSDYLSRRLEADSRVQLHYETTVSQLHGEDHLDAITLDTPDGQRRVESRALFIMIGAAPNTDWLAEHIELDERGFVLTGEKVDRDSPYETSKPGIFAVGDVRAGSVKRVASGVGEGSVVVSRIWSHVDQLRRAEAIGAAA